MARQSHKRKLAAVLHADVKGYSRLMEDDETATFHTLTEYFKIMESMIREFRGRVVNTEGDEMLAEFPSVVNAVRCAVEIQQKLKAKNSHLAMKRRMGLRIGVNLGDVIEEGRSIYGDGVIIAARVQGLAEDGGICISGTAYDQVERKLGLDFNDMGEHSVKNLAKPIRVYRIVPGAPDAGTGITELKSGFNLLRWELVSLACVCVIGAGLYAGLKLSRSYPGSGEKITRRDEVLFLRPEGPSLAVLPFDNLSDNPGLDTFCDGMSENLITTLSKIPELSVASRSSSSMYRDASLSIQDIAKNLGVRYVLEGSAQEHGKGVRFTAQLIDAETGHHLWAEKYDRDSVSIYSRQDEISLKVVLEIQVRLTEGEQARDRYGNIEDLLVWEYVTAGYSLLNRYAMEDTVKAGDLFKKALDLDPDCSSALIGLAWSLTNMWLYWPHNEDRGVSEGALPGLKADFLAQKSVEKYPADPNAHVLYGLWLLMKSDFNRAHEEIKRAVEMSPANAECLASYALCFIAAGDYDKAVEMVWKAIKHHPLYPPVYVLYLGRAYRFSNNYEKAFIAFEEMLKRPDTPEFHYNEALLDLISLYGETGDKTKAERYLDELLERKPNYTVQDVFQRIFYNNKEYIRRYIGGLRNAGLD